MLIFQGKILAFLVPRISVQKILGIRKAVVFL